MLKKISQLFIWGFSGTRVSRDLKKALLQYPPAGLILFKRNIESPRQLRHLTSELQSLSEKPLLIGIDQEGGRVSRLPEPFTQYPPAATWGEIYQRMGHREGQNFLRRIGRYLGRELKSAGINLDFAPVLDVDSNPKNPIIGDRAFSTNPNIVIKTTIPFFKGLLDSGVIPCGKHFPGHGDTMTDSHLTLPVVKKTKAALEKTELAPFRAAIQAKIPMLMTAHVVYPALDPKNPATLSRKILTNFLRKKLRFKGIVISDDLDMKAIANRYSLTEASSLAFNAGVDLILICKDFEKRGSIVEGLAKEAEKGPTLRARLAESLGRITNPIGVGPVLRFRPPVLTRCARAGARP
ncbi:MAG: beta-N-acetylhexosaminidase [Deltaproteobacteria bacterium]|nr:beta-N-acetylhexosaminidase [Deltaproteobacteria bacterium]